MHHRIQLAVGGMTMSGWKPTLSLIHPNRPLLLLWSLAWGTQQTNTREKLKADRVFFLSFMTNYPIKCAIPPNFIFNYMNVVSIRAGFDVWHKFPSVDSLDYNFIAVPPSWIIDRALWILGLVLNVKSRENGINPLIGSHYTNKRRVTPTTRLLCWYRALMRKQLCSYDGIVGWLFIASPMQLSSSKHISYSGLLGSQSGQHSGQFTAATGRNKRPTSHHRTLIPNSD